MHQVTPSPCLAVMRPELLTLAADKAQGTSQRQPKVRSLRPFPWPVPWFPLAPLPFFPSTFLQPMITRMNRKISRTVRRSSTSTLCRTCLQLLLSSGRSRRRQTDHPKREGERKSPQQTSVMAASPQEDKIAEKPAPLAVHVGGALVPVGAAPVVPAHVPPARDYDDDPDDADEGPVKQPKQVEQATEYGTSLTLIFVLAVVAITLAAVITFYAIEPNMPGQTAPPFSTLTPLNSLNATNDTQDGNVDGSI
ncbi:uncharacterized protein [Dermacentor albipictus]|uniref:uncharacterized protein isoform X2 n=1 Tax=Dermacentor albipictus TaxID=60249 RepID=UPI0038FBE90E